MGQTIAVGFVTVIIGMVPSTFISAFHQRGFISMGTEPGAEKRHLRMWRIQDRVVWVFCILYLSYCVFFTLLFLANVSEVDETIWFVAAVISFFELLFLVPVVATIFTLLAVACSMCSSSVCQETAKMCLCAEADDQRSSLHWPPFSKRNALVEYRARREEMKGVISRVI